MPEYVNKDGRSLGAPSGSALETRLLRDGWWDATDPGAKSIDTSDVGELEKTIRGLQETVDTLGQDLRVKDDRIEELEQLPDAEPLKQRIEELEARPSAGPLFEQIEQLQKDLQDEKDLTAALQEELDGRGAELDPEADKTPAADPPAADAAPDVELDALKRPELDGIAAGLGLDPEQYPNKAEVIKAISAAREAVKSNG